MATWSTALTTVTNMGSAMLAQVASDGTNFAITSVKAADNTGGALTLSALKALTALPANIKEDFTITSNKPITYGSAIELELSSEDVTAEYTLMFIGVYAQHSAINNGDPFLYMVAEASVTFDTISPTGAEVVYYRYSFRIVHNPATTVEITVNTAGTATQAEFLELETELKDYVGMSRAYGVEVDYDAKTVTRVGASADLSIGTSPTNKAFFDALSPWSRRRCTLSDAGVVNHYFGDVGYAEDGTDGQVMVEQPKFWYKVEPLVVEKQTHQRGYSLVKARYYVADAPLPGFKVHPAFTKGEDLAEVDNIYLAAYKASLYDVSGASYVDGDTTSADFTADTGDMFCSVADKVPTSFNTTNGATKITVAEARVVAKNRGYGVPSTGRGWQLKDLATDSATQLLYLVEYADFDSQTQIGVGIHISTSGGVFLINGETTALGNDSGAVTAGSDVYVSYRGEENIWGNGRYLLDGLNIYPYNKNDGYFNISGDYTSGTSTDYTDLGFSITKTNYYIQKFGWSTQCDFAFIPTKADASASNGVTKDGVWSNADYTEWLTASKGYMYSGGTAYKGIFACSLGVKLALMAYPNTLGVFIMYVPEVETTPETLPV